MQLNKKYKPTVILSNEHLHLPVITTHLSPDVAQYRVLKQRYYVFMGDVLFSVDDTGRVTCAWNGYTTTQVVRFRGFSVKSHHVRDVTNTPVACIDGLIASFNYGNLYIEIGDPLYYHLPSSIDTTQVIAKQGSGSVQFIENDRIATELKRINIQHTDTRWNYAADDSMLEQELHQWNISIAAVFEKWFYTEYAIMNKIRHAVDDSVIIENKCTIPRHQFAEYLELDAYLSATVPSNLHEYSDKVMLLSTMIQEIPIPPEMYKDVIQHIQSVPEFKGHRTMPKAPMHESIGTILIHHRLENLVPRIAGLAMDSALSEDYFRMLVSGHFRQFFSSI